MRRLVFLIALLALAMPVSLAAAKHTPVNHVFGDVTLLVTELSSVQFTFDVTGDPLSNAASGSFRWRVAGGAEGEMTGSVDCLRVVGNTAYISGTFTEGNLITVGTPFYTTMMDASPDGTGDMVGGIYLATAGFDLTCADVRPADLPIASGNIVIEQCDKITGSGKCKTKD
jgi:hypothetical protein